MGICYDLDEFSCMYDGVCEGLGIDGGLRMEVGMGMEHRIECTVHRHYVVPFGSWLCGLSGNRRRVSVSIVERGARVYVMEIDEPELHSSKTAKEVRQKILDLLGSEQVRR